MRSRLSPAQLAAFRQSGRVRILGMRFWGKHGANPGEQKQTQPIDVDVSLRVDLNEAAANDSLQAALDYDEVYRMCERIVTRRSFRLLEALAQAVADALWQHKKVLGLTVRVRKPRRLAGATPEVEIQRRPLP